MKTAIFNLHVALCYNDNNNNSPLAEIGHILAITWVIIGEFDNLSQILKLLNIILDQFMDCNAIIDHYTHIGVHKLDQNCI